MEPLPDGIVVPQVAAVTTAVRLNSNAQVAAPGTVRKLCNHPLANGAGATPEQVPPGRGDASTCKHDYPVSA